PSSCTGSIAPALTPSQPPVHFPHARPTPRQSTCARTPRTPPGRSAAPELQPPGSTAPTPRANPPPPAAADLPAGSPAPARYAAHEYSPARHVAPATAALRPPARTGCPVRPESPRTAPAGLPAFA